MGSRWVRFYDNGANWAENLDGVSWFGTPIPGRWHYCRSQSRGHFDGHYVRRCSCGAIASGIRPDDGTWCERNTRVRRRKPHPRRR